MPNLNKWPSDSGRVSRKGQCGAHLSNTERALLERGASPEWGGGGSRERGTDSAEHKGARRGKSQTITLMTQVRSVVRNTIKKTHEVNYCVRMLENGGSTVRGGVIAPNKIPLTTIVAYL